MHHCNIMYPSCDTIYTGVMLNVNTTCYASSTMILSLSLSLINKIVIIITFYLPWTSNL